jgi:hypothetical protein
MIESSTQDIVVAIIIAILAILAYRYKIQKDNQKSNLPNKKISDRKINGPKGWISLFQILLGINTFIGSIAIVGQHYEIGTRRFDINQSLPSWDLYLKFTIFLAILNFLSSLYLIYRLEKIHSKSTIKILFIIIYGMIILNFVDLALFYNMDFSTSPIEDARGFKAFLGSLFKVAIIHVPWLIYFKKAERVKNTYS